MQKDKEKKETLKREVKKSAEVDDQTATLDTQRDQHGESKPTTERAGEHVHQRANRVQKSKRARRKNGCGRAAKCLKKSERTKRKKRFSYKAQGNIAQKRYIFGRKSTTGPVKG